MFEQTVQYLFALIRLVSGYTIQPIMQKWDQIQENKKKINDATTLLSTHPNLLTLCYHNMTRYELFNCNKKQTHFTYYWKVLRRNEKCYYIKPCDEEKTINAIINHFEIDLHLNQKKYQTSFFKYVFLSFIIKEDYELLTTINQCGYIDWDNKRYYAFKQSFFNNIHYDENNETYQFSKDETEHKYNDSTKSTLREVLAKINICDKNPDLLVYDSQNNSIFIMDCLHGIGKSDVNSKWKKYKAITQNVYVIVANTTTYTHQISTKFKFTIKNARTGDTMKQFNFDTEVLNNNISKFESEYKDEYIQFHKDLLHWKMCANKKKISNPKR